jgi:hypothetical protein
MSLASGFPRWKVGRTPKRPRRMQRVSTKMRRNREELGLARPLLLERSQGQCEARISHLCTGIGIHAHHIERRVHGGTNALENLLWVCWFCHDRIHAHPAEAVTHGLLKSGWTR